MNLFKKGRSPQTIVSDDSNRTHTCLPALFSFIKVYANQGKQVVDFFPLQNKIVEPYKIAVKCIIQA